MINHIQERFGLHWPGKAACRKLIQQPAIATLLTMREQSVDFDTSNNLIIEGDNLEVLRLLQESHFGKIKMIYIDPPYNTGKEFIYPDHFHENIKEYLHSSGQIKAQYDSGSNDIEIDGRYHSNWLNMMYPRLSLAKNLLTEDGVMFISIDDNELANLKNLCDEIFSAENAIGIFVVNSTPNARDYGHIGKMHEYALMYAKNAARVKTNRIPEKNKHFKYQDTLGGFNLHPLYNSNEAFNSTNRPNLYYPFYLNPNRINAQGLYEIDLDRNNSHPHSDLIAIYPPKSKKSGTQFVWRWGKDKSSSMLNQEIVGYKTRNGEYRIMQKMRHQSKILRSLLIDTLFSTRRGTAEVEELFHEKIFSFPKPVNLIKQFLIAGSEPDSIILDFFAGSGTTAHAVMELNQEDKGGRQFILVQIPEPTNHPIYPTIADITRERVRRVGEKLRMGSAKPALDLGFRAMRLSHYQS